MKRIVKAIETKDGYFVDNKYLFYNRKQPTETFNYNWFFVPKTDEPLLIEEKESSEIYNRRLELFDKTLANEKIPLILECEQDDNYEWVPKNSEHKHLSSLYRLAFDTKPETFKIADVDFQIILKTEVVNTPEAFSFRIACAYNKIQTITQNSFKNSVLDSIMFPSMVLHELPMTADSQLVYAILRQYIKDNIDNTAAEITSDYDFCFSVEKKIKLTKIEEFVRTIEKGKGRCKRKVRETQFLDTRKRRVFEMTYSPKNYSDYTPIKEITGKNAKELRDKIINLCEETIKLINEPIADCPHCDGKGVIYPCSKK